MTFVSPITLGHRKIGLFICKGEEALGFESMVEGWDGPTLGHGSEGEFPLLESLPQLENILENTCQKEEIERAEMQRQE